MKEESKLKLDQYNLDIKTVNSSDRGDFLRPLTNFEVYRRGSGSSIDTAGEACEEQAAWVKHDKVATRIRT